jgi:hypothetical protein
VALSINRTRPVYSSKHAQEKSAVPRDCRHIGRGGLETENGELRAVATGCLKGPYWGRWGFAAVERRYCELLVGREEGKGKGVLAGLNGMATVLGTEHGPSEMERRYCELLVGREEGKGKGVLAALNGMVTVLGELNMDRLNWRGDIVNCLWDRRKGRAKVF